MAAAGAALVWIYLVPLIGLAPDLTAGMSAQEAEILRLVNDERKRGGASPLKSSQRLVLASRGHSADRAKLAQRAVQQWLRSPEHRANMLSPVFDTTGVGVARAADGTAYVTQDFVK
jgi:uncharacterized protein YkwD